MSQIEDQKDSDATSLTIDFQLLNSSFLKRVIENDKGKFPSTIRGLRERFSPDDNNSNSVVVPFSAAPSYTDIREPRYLIFGDREIFFGIIERENGSREMEFIARKDDAIEMDFGIVENFGAKNAKIKSIDSAQCMGCHKAGGAIFYNAFWETTLVAVNTDSLRAAFLEYWKDKVEVSGKKKMLNGIPVQVSKPEELAELIETRVLSSGALTLLGRILSVMSAEERYEVSQFFLSISVCKELPQSIPERIEAILVKNWENLPRESRLSTLRKPPKTLMRRGRGGNELGPDEWVNMNREEINDYQKIKREKNLPNVAIGDSTTLPEMFAPPSKNNFLGVGSYAQKSELMKNFQQYLDVKSYSSRAQIEDFCNSSLVDKLAALDHLPSFSEVRTAVLERKIVPAVKAKSPYEVEVRHKSCQDCHSGTVKGIPVFPFDVADPSSWAKDWDSLSSDKAKKDRKNLARKVLDSIESDYMPPSPFKIHLSAVQLFGLKRFLTDYGKQD